ncbi:uncharacterized protein BP5553_06124 [Venustampulla echinocandica]|uniref:Serine aminopeptidase S33 domain-containing protein n=1 Tax=Venustampulla echinocandica TaxID=2656787 RepID=A0A370TMM1_9HELO|nr:uncharacterized protein BP5553_06124 [Venustampulla echinocandica]RDL36772.1 hypothetical protein BP5553_06124 [Venustampulla echinocandica]
MERIFHRVVCQGFSRDSYLIVASSVATTLAVVALAKTIQPTPKKIIASPRTTVLPRVSQEEQGELPYPPDIFPGARDVNSPYGSIRVYEWGPLTGRRVLLLHGISTPCISLGGIANTLVSKGCRVMLVDLWGRGYSDSPDLPHDSRLYTTEILLAITSSSVAWTPEGFSVVGYSLGGGIAADFAAHFPALVKGLVLLAPAGLMRPEHFGWSSKLLSSGLVPDPVLEWIIRRRLTGGPPNTTTAQKLMKSKSKATPEAVIAAEEIKDADTSNFNSVPLSKNRPNVTVASAVKWQIANNEGFIRSFVSSIKFASISGKAEVWKSLRQLEEKVLIIAGKTDPIIVPEELHDDAIEAIGAENVEWRVIHGGHEFPITVPELVVNEISEVWGL